jgi:hypothetical protein
MGPRNNIKLSVFILAAVVICAAVLLFLNDDDDSPNDPEPVILISEVMTGGVVDEAKFKALLRDADGTLTITVPYDTPGLDDLIIPNGVFLSDSGGNIKKIIEIFIVDDNREIIYGWAIDGNNIHLGTAPVFKIAMTMTTDGSNAPLGVKESVDRYVTDNNRKDIVIYLHKSLSGELPYYSWLRYRVGMQYADQDFQILYYLDTSTEMIDPRHSADISSDGYFYLPTYSDRSIILVTFGLASSEPPEGDGGNGNDNTEEILISAAVIGAVFILFTVAGLLQRRR